MSASKRPATVLESLKQIAERMRRELTDLDRLIVDMSEGERRDKGVAPQEGDFNASDRESGRKDIVHRRLRFKARPSNPSSPGNLPTVALGPGARQERSLATTEQFADLKQEDIKNESTTADLNSEGPKHKKIKIESQSDDLRLKNSDQSVINEQHDKPAGQNDPAAKTLTDEAAETQVEARDSPGRGRRPRSVSGDLEGQDERANTEESPHNGQHTERMQRYLWPGQRPIYEHSTWINGKKWVNWSMG